MARSLFSRGHDQGGRGKGDVLERAPLLALLEPELRQRVRKRLNRRRIAVGKPIYRLDDPSNELYLIESGRVRVFGGGRVDQERVLHFLGPGVTTLAVHLASSLAEHHPYDTVLLDLDVLFGHALANLWLEPKGVLAQISPVTMRSLDRVGLDHYLLIHTSSLRVFPAATHP